METTLSTHTTGMTDQAFTKAIEDYKKNKTEVLNLFFYKHQSATPVTDKRKESMLELCSNRWLPKQLVLRVDDNSDLKSLIEKLNKRSEPHTSFVFDFKDRTIPVIDTTNTLNHPWIMTMNILRTLGFLSQDKLTINLSGTRLSRNDHTVYTHRLLNPNDPKDPKDYIYGLLNHIHAAPPGFILNIDNCLENKNDADYLMKELKNHLQDSTIPKDFTLLTRYNSIDTNLIKKLLAIRSNNYCSFRIIATHDNKVFEYPSKKHDDIMGKIFSSLNIWSFLPKNSTNEGRNKAGIAYSEYKKNTQLFLFFISSVAINFLAIGVLYGTVETSNALFAIMFSITVVAIQKYVHYNEAKNPDPIVREYEDDGRQASALP